MHFLWSQGREELISFLIKPAPESLIIEIIDYEGHLWCHLSFILMKSAADLCPDADIFPVEEVEQCEF